MVTTSKQIIQEIAASIEVTRYLAPREYLEEVYQRSKARLESYSYLLFAEDLGFSQTNVIRLMIAGKRPMTGKAGERIAKGLGLAGAEKRYFTTLVEYSIERLPAERERLFQQLMSCKTKAAPEELDPIQAEYFGEWYHPIIRELVGLSDFDGDPEWIKSRLGFPLRLEQIKRSLELLERLKVIRFDRASGRFVRSEGRIHTASEVDAMAVVRYHQKMIEIGREAITQVAEDRRDVRAVTVSLPKSALPLLKGKIEEFVAQIAAMEDGVTDADDVVQVNVQMFPFTKG